MSRSSEGGSAGSGSGGSRFDLGSATEYVDGGRVEWGALVSYLVTVGVLFLSDTIARFLGAVLELPRLFIAAVGGLYQEATERVVGFWPSVFETSFESASTSLPELGVIGFLVAIAFVIVWYLILDQVLEVL